MTEELGLDAIVWRAADKPREVDAHCVALDIWGAFGEVIRQKVIIHNIHPEAFSALSLAEGQMVVVVCQEVRLLVRTSVLLTR